MVAILLYCLFSQHLLLIFSSLQDFVPRVCRWCWLACNLASTEAYQTVLFALAQAPTLKWLRSVLERLFFSGSTRLCKVLRSMASSTIFDLFVKDTDAQVDFNVCKMWHPRFCFKEFAIPPWLMDYKIAHFDKHHTTLTPMVHKLYHVVLDNEIDRLQMANAVATAETFSIIRPAGNEGNSINAGAVAAITFASIGRKVIVLFLAIDDRYRESGFGSQLLMLVGQCLLHRERRDVCMFLLGANKQSNSKAWSFYTRRGFQRPSKDFFETIPEFVNHPILGEFIHSDDGEQLQLLCLKHFNENFILGPPTAAKALF